MKVFPGDNLVVHQALDVAKPGDIIVVDGSGSGSRTNALIGDHYLHKSLTSGLQRFVIDGLIQQPGRRSFFHSLCQELIAAAETYLPGHVPSALAHGDFAPRNILVANDGRVTVFDTQCCW